jgi:hypothetical protein
MPLLNICFNYSFSHLFNVCFDWIIEIYSGTIFPTWEDYLEEYCVVCLLVSKSVVCLNKEEGFKIKELEKVCLGSCFETFQGGDHEMIEVSEPKI